MTKRTDDRSISKETTAVYNSEMSSLPSSSAIQNKPDTGKLVMTGEDSDYVTYELVKVDEDYVYQMISVKPRYTDKEDDYRKGYVVENLYRMCGFSGSSEGPRSYKAYKKQAKAWVEDRW